FAGAAAMALSATAANAQFGSLFNDARRGAETAAEGCEGDKSGDMASGVIGGLLGGAARRTANDAGLGAFVPVSEFTDTLTREIACKLNAEEQEQAAEATLEATRGGDEDGLEGPPVGQSASWTSNSRDDVQGSSTVTAREDTGDDLDCITVTDVIIVEGEETRAEKRMCRPPGKARYSIVA
ncbi:MAG: hypothetical protein AAFQ90_08675, partial [Pseudomonadota bacterium]